MLPRNLPAVRQTLGGRYLSGFGRRAALTSVHSVAQEGVFFMQGTLPTFPSTNTMILIGAGGASKTVCLLILRLRWCHYNPFHVCHQLDLWRLNKNPAIAPAIGVRTGADFSKIAGACRDTMSTGTTILTGAGSAHRRRVPQCNASIHVSSARRNAPFIIGGRVGYSQTAIRTGVVSASAPAPRPPQPPVGGIPLNRSPPLPLPLMLILERKFIHW